MKHTNPEDPTLPVWYDDQQQPISCTEKIKVLNENHRELRQVLLDALEDGILMGCDEAHLRACFHALVDEVDNRFK